MAVVLLGIWVFVGLGVGWLTGFLFAKGGFGLKGDLALGVGGSLVLSVSCLGLVPWTSVVAVVAAVGAASGILVQRLFWRRAPANL